MSNRFVFYSLILIVVGVVAWIISDTISQPGISDLKGEFKEMAFYRNENNTGPIKRIYAVYTSDTTWTEMKAYGGYMPHTKYGNTKVYFFNSLDHTPKFLKPEAPHFDAAWKEYCIGMYEKSAMGQENFIRYPFN
ncbi:hypothetical protein [Cecembia rubra]|uniref:hypothetical protein n=1 Tax=Cecembia rubra TaxID=1485585 RepID=UPI00271484F5|nr:hypothetical protein [Cecembia rubra]